MKKMKIFNFVDTLAWHPERRWGKRNIDRIDTIVVHQSAVDASVYKINAGHIEPTFDRDEDGVIEPWEKNHISSRGCPHIAYHVFIDKQGKIHLCNAFTDWTWHAGVFNARALGVCVQGSFNGNGWKGVEPTVNQIQSLVQFLEYAKYLLPAGVRIKGHCEVDPLRRPACPGYKLMEVIKSVREEG